MMWVIRAGQNSLYYDKYIDSSRVYIPWDGYKFDLSGLGTCNEFRKIVEKEKETDNRTSVSNWAGQLYSFVQEIDENDYVLIPSKGSHKFCLARIVGEYHFDKESKEKLYHYRDIEILETGIPKKIFSQDIIYSLGAFRTIFKAKHEDEILKTIKIWKEQQR